MQLSDFYPEFKGWVPAQTANGTSAPQVPDEKLQSSAYLRAPLPLPMQYSGDTIKQYYRPGLSSFRNAPQSPSSFPAVNAIAAGIAQNTVSTATVAAAVAAVNANPPSSGGTDTDIIAGVNRLLFGGQDNFSQVPKTSTSNSINSSSVTSFASGTNEFAIVTAIGSSSPSSSGQNPGGWTAQTAGMYSNTISAAGAFTVGQVLAPAVNCSVQTLLLLKSNGSTPVLTLRASGSGSTTFNAGSFTPGAGNALLWTVISVGLSAKPAPTITDSQGLVWQLLANLYVPGGPTNASNASIVQYLAQNVAAVSMTSTLDISAATGGSGTWTLHEISNVNLGSGAYTFQTSDNLNLVEFAGGANVVATLPSPALAAGWQALASNSSVGNVTLTSAAYINNSSTSVALGPGSSTWIFSDGTRYWLTTSASAANTPKLAHQWLDSYNPLTGLFGQSQPSVADLSTNKTGSGNIVLATTPLLSNPTLSSCTLANTINVNNVFARYNNIATVGNGVPAEYANVANATAVANIGSIPLYAVPTSGLYRLSYYVIVNRAATTSSTLPDLQFTWTDPDNSTVQTFGPVDSATPSANTLTTMYSGTAIISAKAATNINYQTGVTTAYASVGATAMRYSIYVMLEAL